jgi:hypothetical protein
MPQGPIPFLNTADGSKVQLNIVAGGVVVAPATRVVMVSVLAAGASSSGPLVINDSLTVASAATPNEIWNVASGSTVVTAKIDMPVKSGGFVVSSLPASCRIAVSYY